METGNKHIYLIFTAQHLLHNYLVKKLKENGIRITPAHSTILFTLEQESPCSMTELSQTLHLDNSTVTGLIDRLEKSGLIIRTASPDDRRKSYISITDKGSEEIRKARKVINLINKEIESDFSQKEIQTFHKILNSLKNKFC